jgi:hypothetical protein
MITKRINIYKSFDAVLDAVLDFGHDENAEGVVQCILLDGGRAITACVTRRRADVMISKDGPNNKKLLERRLKDLLEFGEVSEFVVQMGGRAPIHWQISD